MLADFEAHLVGALAGYKGDYVVIPDLEGNFCCGLALYNLRDGAWKPVTGAQFHRFLLYSKTTTRAV